MTRISTKDWRNLPIERWNVTTYHQMLIDSNRELFDAEYVPFGKGALSTRWHTEKGMIKQAQEKYGNTVLKRFIERCLAKHKPKASYPHINFGFMWSYMRDELPRVQAEIAQENRKETRKGEVNSGMSDDELLDLL